MAKSSYGRLGIRPAKNEKCFIHECSQLINFLEDPAIKIVSLDAMKNGNVLRASMNIELEQQNALPISSVALASAITSMARIHLLKIILHANEKPNVIPLYSDTDCLISLHPKSMRDEDFIMNPGMKIGQMKRELAKNEYIETFVSLGAKVYGYKTNQGQLKLCCKGIHQSSKSYDILNVETLEKQLLSRVNARSRLDDQDDQDDQDEPITVQQVQFTRKIVPTPTLGLREMDKKVNVTLNKRVHIFNLNEQTVENILGYKANDHINPMFKFYSLPYGWSEELLKQVAQKFEQIHHHHHNY